MGVARVLFARLGLLGEAVGWGVEMFEVVLGWC
jgi:hypothetical protein